nr:hypothetical protein [Saprospiraceae bacterium]
MNLETAKKKLQKINSLIETFEPGDSSVSRLESDLLMNYTREFYDALISTGKINSSGENKNFEKNKSHLKFEKTHSPQEQVKRDSSSDRVSERKPEPVLSSAENPSSQLKSEQASFRPLPEEPKEETEKKNHADEAVITVKSSSSSDRGESQVKVVETSRATPTDEKTDVKPEIYELFKIKKANEISEKLSQLPITDLNKAMGVNEKIYVKNELFDGDDLFFQQTIKRLNSMENFDQAKDYLTREVAGNLKWSEPEKVKKAKNFIQLVYRRYK